MTWSDHEEELYQLRHHRARLLNWLLLAAFVLFTAALVISRNDRHQPGLGLLSGLAFAGSGLAFAASFVLGWRWEMLSNTGESWSGTRDRKAARREQAVRRAQAIADGTWRPRA